MGKLASGLEISSEEVLTMVKSPSLRHAVFRILEVYNRKELFPADYFTHEKGAEGFLVNWLEFPTELGNAPDEIELFTIVTLKLDQAWTIMYSNTEPIPLIGPHSTIG